jgi:cytochrome c
MKFLTATVALFALAAPVYAEGDVTKGEKAFKKCKSCHMVVSPEGETIVKGGKTGPNLYGVIGRQAGSVEGFKYGKSLVEAGEGGLIWDEASVAAFTKDPKAFLKEATGSGSAKSKMSFKLKKGGEDVAAYLASVAPAPEADAAATE